MGKRVLKVPEVRRERLRIILFFLSLRTFRTYGTKGTMTLCVKVWDLWDLRGNDTLCQSMGQRVLKVPEVRRIRLKLCVFNVGEDSSHGDADIVSVVTVDDVDILRLKEICTHYLVDHPLYLGQV